MKLPLCLIEIKEYRGRDDTQKIKLIFVSEKGQYYVGYANKGELLPNVEAMQKVDDYDPALAKELQVDRDLFDDKLTYKVAIS